MGNTMLTIRDDITAKLLASSVCDITGTRIDTLQLRFPRIILAEVNTHRAISKNASSSRAIPVASILSRDEIFIPNFKYNKPGMQPADYLNPEDQRIAAEIWQEMADFCTSRCKLLADKNGLNVAKQWANRPLEWFGYTDSVITSTDWANWDFLRDHDAAQDEIQVLARKIKEAREKAVPRVLGLWDWHLPYIRAEDIDYTEFLCDPKRNDQPAEVRKIMDILQSISFDICNIPPAVLLQLAISAARCCRVSYARHDGEPSTLSEDVNRCLQLVQFNQPVHASPFEHQATPWGSFGHQGSMTSNFRNFLQFRKLIKNESVKDAA